MKLYEDPSLHEQTFIAQILMDSRILNETIVTEESFSDYKACLVFRAMRSLWDRNIKPDIISVHDFDQNIDAVYLACSTSLTPSAANWRYYEGVIVESWRRRKLANVGVMLSSSDDESSRLIEGVEKSLLEIQTAGGRQKIERIGSGMVSHLYEIEERYKNRGSLPGISTGKPKLDRQILGLRDRLFYVIGGRPSTGKSAMLQDIAEYVTATCKIPAGMISIESSKKEVTNRMLSKRGRIDGEKILSGYLSEDDFTNLLSASESIDSAPLEIWDQPDATLNDVRSVARTMRRKCGIRILFIDYLQLIQIPGSEDRKAEVSMVSRALKALARELGIPIVAAAQLGRDADNKRPTLGDFQWSSQIEQDADVAILIWHQGKKGSNEEQSWWLIDKCRDGKTGGIRHKFERNYTSFTENIDEGGY